MDTIDYIRSNTYGKLAVNVTTAFALIGILVLSLASPMLASASPMQGKGSSQPVYKFRQGADSGQGVFVKTYVWDGIKIKERIGVSCDATASSKPTFMLSYQLIMNGDKDMVQRTIIHNQTRVKQICKLRNNGVLAIRGKAASHPNMTFEYLFLIAEEKGILPAD